jgi:hypothetical protein
MGVNKQIWLPIIKEGFYPKTSFLQRSVDMSAFVENESINLADAGVDPTVLINNTTYPINSAVRTDANLNLPLDTYDSENTIIRNIEAMQTAYNKMESVARQHKNAILKKFAAKAANAWAPASNAANTPVLVATGGDNGTGLKRLTFEDIMALQKAYNDADWDDEGRCILLSSQHQADLLVADKVLYKSLADLKEGKVNRFMGFDFYFSSVTPMYNKTTGVKKAFGAAAAGTDAPASIAWLETEVMKADGMYDMFYQLKSPTERGDIIGFQKRGLALPIRSKAIGAIYSPATA